MLRPLAVVLPCDLLTTRIQRAPRNLWHFNVGQRIQSSPMSYGSNGKQSFAIAAGRDLFFQALPFCCTML